jgi:hypothetical protein
VYIRECAHGQTPREGEYQKNLIGVACGEDGEVVSKFASDHRHLRS